MPYILFITLPLGAWVAFERSQSQGFLLLLAILIAILITNIIIKKICLFINNSHIQNVTYALFQTALLIALYHAPKLLCANLIFFPAQPTIWLSYIPGLQAIYFAGYSWLATYIIFLSSRYLKKKVIFITFFSLSSLAFLISHFDKQNLPKKTVFFVHKVNQKQCYEKILYESAQSLKKEIVKNKNIKTFLSPEGFIEIPNLIECKVLFEEIFSDAININITWYFGGHINYDNKSRPCIYEYKNKKLRCIKIKNHLVPYAESCSSTSHTLQNKHCTIHIDQEDYYIYICSEILCTDDIPHNNIICFASDEWTKPWYVRLYSYLMKCHFFLKNYNKKSCLVLYIN